MENLVVPRKAFAVLRFVDSLTFQPVTSSPQGPPSYSTHAALHSNQILTLKVCHPLTKANSSFASPRRGLTSFASLLDGKKGNLSLFQLSPLASTSRGLLMYHLCFSPQQLFASLWTDACTVLAISAFLISVLFFVCIFPLPSLSFNSSSLFAVSPRLAPSTLFCTSDGLPQLQPRLYLWRSVQQLSETLSEGRSQQKACLLINHASPSAFLVQILPEPLPPTFSISFLFSVVLHCACLVALMRLIKSFKDSKDEEIVLPNL